MTNPFDVLSPEQARLIRRTITAHLSDDEHELFLEAAQRSGLDPFARHIYPLRKTVYDGTRKESKLTIEATIDGLRLSAERTGKYTGQLGPEWCGPDGVWRDIWTCEEPPVAARVGILRSDFAEPVWGKAVYSEFVQLERGMPTQFWANMPSNQIAKCAEALAFRKAFPREFSGLYTPEEMAQADSISGRFAGRSSDSPARRPASSADNPDQGDFPAVVPLPLQPFFDAGLSDRRNLQAAYQFVQRELDHAPGDGTGTFRAIYARHLGHGLFATRAKCEAANRACLIELWCAVEVAQQRKEAA